MNTLYNVPTEVTYHLEYVVDHINDLISRNSELTQELADMEGSIEELEETLYQRNQLIHDLRMDIQLISENK